ncbi:MAG: XRE family transcriptional regulator [Pseudonocardiales bacterium]|nr:MAG: XRE family transcriptional regulator [Pseudonocardiales bacterium]
MTEPGSWAEVKDRRMGERGAREAYHAAKLAYELGRAVRQLSERRGWSQMELARTAGMTQSAVARFEAGGTMPTLPVLDRLAQSLEAELVVQVTPRAHVA